MGRLNRYLPPICIMVMTMVTGCATSHIPPQQKVPPTAHGNLSKARHIVVKHALESVGVSYAWGGSSPATGFDCSGLVTFTHSRAGITTPRTARDQFIQGRFVNFPDLLPGDLVFFRPSSRKSGYHVGIYTGKNGFVHAPGRGRTVAFASLNNPYFRKYYIGARSYL